MEDGEDSNANREDIVIVKTWERRQINPPKHLKNYESYPANFLNDVHNPQTSSVTVNDKDWKIVIKNELNSLQ